MSRTRYKIWEQDQPHFLTCTVVDWIPVFTRPEAACLMLDSWKFLQDQHRIKLYGYVILENHLHFLASAVSLSNEVKSFKSYTARRIIDFFKERADHRMLERLAWEKLFHKYQSSYQLWQEGSQPKRILDDEMMDQKLTYLHDNPVERGYVDRPEHWRYSSARNYLGLEGLIPVTTTWR